MVERPRLGARACIGCLAKISKQARKLYSGSLVSASTWGHPASNLANSQTEALEKEERPPQGFAKLEDAALLYFWLYSGHVATQ